MNRAEIQAILDRQRLLFGGPPAQYSALAEELLKRFSMTNQSIFSAVVDRVNETHGGKGCPTLREYGEAGRAVNVERNVPDAMTCANCDGHRMIPCVVRRTRDGKRFEAVTPCKVCNRAAADKAQPREGYVIDEEAPVPRSLKMTSEEHLAWCIEEASKLTPKGARKTMELAHKYGKTFPPQVLEIIQEAAAKA